MRPKDGSRTARPTTVAMPSWSSALEAGAGERISGSTRSAARIRPAKTTKTWDQGRNARSPSARGGPTTWPAEPAAVTTARAMERLSSEAARPTTARMTPKPVPAMPKPTRIS
jgi:hypothetical protein